MSVLSDALMQVINNIQQSPAYAYAGSPIDASAYGSYGCRNQCSGSCEGECYGSCESSCFGGALDFEDC